MTRYAIGLGSNLGDRAAHLSGACDGISQFGHNMRISSVFETEPVGGPEQGPYLNAVVSIDSDLDPAELLSRLGQLEKAHARERTTRWGPRTLDLDVIASDGPFSDDPHLTIPHPRAHERRFVVEPLVEVWPDAPVGPGLTAAAALGSLPDDGVDRLLGRWHPSPPTWPGAALVAIQLLIFAGVGLAIVLSGRLPGAQDWATSLLGLLLAVAGGFLALAATRRLGPGLTALPAPRERSVLVGSGPYSFVRHPIYGGVVLALLGVSILFGSVWAEVFSVSLIPFFWFKSVYEERLLRFRFGGYQAYRSRVTKRLIPFLI